MTDETQEHNESNAAAPDDRDTTAEYPVDVEAIDPGPPTAVHYKGAHHAQFDTRAEAQAFVDANHTSWHGSTPKARVHCEMLDPEHVTLVEGG